MVFHQGGRIITFIAVPSSFQTPSLFEPLTLKTYSPGSRLVKLAVLSLPEFIHSSWKPSNL